MIASALSGVRVLDFGRYIAGPYCATVLGDLGADVIRIDDLTEAPDRTVTTVSESGAGALFMHVGRNKRSLTLNLTHPGAKPVLEKLVAQADVVVSNMPRKSLAKLGLDYPSLQAIKPDIIAMNITAFGENGPWRDRPGFDTVGQAMSGAIALGGTPEQPYRAHVTWVDYGTALHGVVGILAALQERARSGRGQEVSTSLLGTALSFQNSALIDQEKLGLNRKGLANRAFNTGPTDIFKTRDGWIASHVVGNAMFARWARLMGEEEKWLSDPRFKTDTLRGANGAVLSERMAAWCADRTCDEAVEGLASAQVPAAPVLDLADVHDHPQVAAMGALEPVSYKGAEAHIAMLPLALSETPAAIHRGPPTLGEHTGEILSWLGFDDAAITALKADGVV